MPRKKTEELAVMPEAPALPVVPEEAAEQPVTEECLPETAANPVVEDITASFMRRNSTI